MTQRLSEAKRSGDIVLQAKWLTELGNTNVDKKDYEAALQHYNEMLVLDEDDKEAISHRGHIALLYRL